MRFTVRPAIILALAAVVARGQASPDAAHSLRGLISTTTGVPVPGASVFLLESLETAQTDSAGRFIMRTTATGNVTLVARRIGFAPATIVVPVDTAGVLKLTLLSQAPVLAPIRVQAGAYTAGNE